MERKATDAQRLIDECVTLASNLPPGSMIGRLVAYYLWVDRGGCMIRDVHGVILPMRLNRTQRIVVSAMMQQALQNKPIRITVLKARKRGVTTLIQTLFAFLVCHGSNQIAITLAHLPKSTREIFQMSKLAMEHWTTPDIDPQVWTIEFPASRGRMWCHTASSHSVVAGGTPNFLHKSEIALWKLNKRETDYASNNAIEDTPGTIIVDESTARGRELFYDRWEAAHQADHRYIPIFIPWYVDRDGDDRTAAVIDEDEVALVGQAKRDWDIELSEAHLEWRRAKILEDGIDIFRQEHPATPQEAIQGAADLILPGLRDCLIDTLSFLPKATALEARVGGIDHGYADPTAIVTGFYRDQTLYIVAVYRAYRALATENAEGIFDWHTYYCDPSGLSDRKELADVLMRSNRNAYLRPAPRPPDKKEATVVQAEWRLLNQMRQQGRLKILTDVAEQLILESDNLRWNERTGQPDMTRGEPWGHFDTLCALRYLAMGCLFGAIEAHDMPTREPSRREMLRA